MEANPKNGLVSDLYARSGFTQLQDDSADETRWSLQIADYQPGEVPITLEGMEAV
jgi:hypothetical protein